MPDLPADRKAIRIPVGGRSQSSRDGDQYVGIVHPCKIYNVPAVKKPFLYIGPNESHVMDIIGQSDAYVSSHGDVEGVVANILRAMKNSALDLPCGVQVERTFSKEQIVPKMISAIERSDWHGRSRDSSCAA